MFPLKKISCKKKKLSRLVKTPDELIKEETEVWERQPDEPIKAFKMFQFYRDLPDRKLFDGRIKKHFKCSNSLIGYYSSVYQWRERARCYDNHLDRIKQKAMAQKIEEMATRHAEEAVMAQKSLMYPIYEFLSKIDTEDNDIKPMTAKELFRIVIDAVDKLQKVIEVERKALGADINKTELDIKSDGKSVVPVINIEVVGSRSPLLEKIEDAEFVEHKNDCETEHNTEI